MSHRNWLLYSVVGGIGVFAAIAVASQAPHCFPSLFENFFSSNEISQSRFNDYNYSAKESVDWANAVLGQGIPDIPCPNQAADCSEPYHNALDLKAQWATAEAAANMVCLTIYQIIIGLAGLAALLCSLLLTRSSLELTRESLKSAAESAAATVRAAEAAVATERARLYVQLGGNDFPGIFSLAQLYDVTPSTVPENKGVSYNFKNFGKTPAIIKEVMHGISVAKEPGVFVYGNTMDDQVGHVLYEQAETKPNMLFHMGALATNSDVLEVIKGNKTIWIFGRVIYEDVFGISQTHRFLFRYAKVGHQGSWVFQSYDYEHYNKST
jgi:hypothetical protein